MHGQNKGEIELLKTVAGQEYEQCKPEWSRLLRALHLAPTYVPAIQEMLRDSRWSGKSNPIGYVRNGAVRWAVRHGLVEARRKPSKEVLASELNFTDGDGEPLGHDDKLGLALCQFDETSVRESIVDYLPAEVVDEFHEEVNWDKVADLAGLDPGERIVLDLRLMGLGWRDALEACLTEDDRAILYAAWRRFDRHKEVLKQVLLTAKAHRARRIEGSGEEYELMFTENEEGRLKIFFKRTCLQKRK
jgi:hypothetical protein